MPRAKELITTLIDRLVRDGWTVYDGADWPEQARVEIITRGGRLGYAVSRFFWWGRYDFDARRDNATLDEKRALPPPHPTTGNFTRQQRQPHNEIIAWRHSFKPIAPGDGPGQFTTDPYIQPAYRDLP